MTNLKKLEAYARANNITDIDLFINENFPKNASAKDIESLAGQILEVISNKEKSKYVAT